MSQAPIFLLKLDAYENISRASSPVASVERITVGILTDVFYRLGIDGSFIQNTGTSNLLYDQFSTHAKTQVIGEVGIGLTVIDVDSTVGFAPVNSDLVRWFDNPTRPARTWDARDWAGDCTNQRDGQGNLPVPPVGRTIGTGENHLG